MPMDVHEWATEILRQIHALEAERVVREHPVMWSTDLEDPKEENAE